jgi:HEAT repeat protein
MADDDQDVRDYATFGLGSCSDLDSPGIREALLQRVADSFADVRYEALVGLGKRRDVRVVPHVLRALHESPTNDWVIEAAYLMLGLPEAQKGWGPGDYADALRREYGAA